MAGKDFLFENIEKEFPLTWKDFKQFMIDIDSDPDCIDSFDVIQYLISKKLDKDAWREGFEKLEGDFQFEKANREVQPNKGTYKRKYYLHRQVKKAGFSLKLELKHKTINVPYDETHKAKENKYVQELQQQYNYGVQTAIV